MVYSYGTNVHNATQKSAGDVDDWEMRYLFLPNSAYAMRISHESYHSVSELPEGFTRRTMVVNWFRSESGLRHIAHGEKSDAQAKG